jgi:tetratricopeptide (TPR) repeat protein
MTAAVQLRLAAEAKARGDWAEAHAILEAAATEFPDDPDVGAQLGLSLCARGDEDAAFELLDLGARSEDGSGLVQTLFSYYSLKAQADARLGIDPSASLRKQNACSASSHAPLNDPPPLTLTACLIVRDEERHLANCLHSIAEVADQIVIIDTGSVDQSVEIAKAFGATVGEFTWTNDFAAARNESLRLATGSWVLWIDADERLAPGALPTLLSAMIRTHIGGYAIDIVNYLSEETTEDRFVHSPCRLFQRLEGVAFEGTIHEQVGPSIERLGLPIARLDGTHFDHFGYRQDEMDAKSKAARNFAAITAALEHDPEDGFQWFNLGNAHFTAGDYEQAAAALARATDLVGPGAQHGQVLHYMLAASLTALERAEEAISACHASRRAGYGGPLIDFAEAAAEFKAGNLEDALTLSQKAGDGRFGSSEAGDRSIVDYKAKFLEGQILSASGEAEAAAVAFKTVLAVAPNFAPAMICLAVEERALGNAERALETALHAQATGREPAASAEVAALCLQDLGRHEEALLVRRSAWESNATDASLWGRWVAAAEASGEWAAACEAYAAGSGVFEFGADLLISAGQAFAKAGEPQAALGCFERAAAVDPACANAYFCAGDALYASGQYVEAAGAYQAGLAHAPNHTEAWFTLGNALYRAGSPEGASIAYRQALSIEPDHAGARSNLKEAESDLQELAS